MKKLFVIILGMLVSAQAIAMISPLDQKLRKARQEYAQSQIICPDSRPLFVNGVCIACNEYKNWNDVAGIVGCEKCKNSNECFGNYCCLNCPDDRPLLLSNGSCAPCDYKPNRGPVFDVFSGRERCSNYRRTR